MAEKGDNFLLDQEEIDLLEIIKKNPLEEYPPFETLIGNLEGAFSWRINIQLRLVYQVYEKEKIVKVISMWTHYNYPVACQAHQLGTRLLPASYY